MIELYMSISTLTNYSKLLNIGLVRPQSRIVLLLARIAKRS